MLTSLLRTIAVAGVAAFTFGPSLAQAETPRDPFLESSFAGPTVNAPAEATGAVEQVAYTASLPEDTLASALVTDIAPESDSEISLAGCYDCPPTGCYGDPCGCDCWGWHALPTGLIYRSYWAGPRESRIGTTVISNRNFQRGTEAIWDGTVGGRAGLLRYGNSSALRPQGWQLDIEGAALVRLNLEEERDVDASDFRFGVPLTYGSGNTQYKIGYYHLSSHIGDEFLDREPGFDRINYVRDALVLGISKNPTPAWRVYGEVAYAFYVQGGAEPWEFQFGAEYAQPGCTGFRGTPFFATNAHLREEIDFSGDWTTQLGWLWRGRSGSTMRVGLHYMNGKSTNYQFFSDNEEQIGFGAWYDF